MGYKQYIDGNTQNDWIEYIVQSLQGTCGSLGEYLDEYLEEGFDELELCKVIDANIGECSECGWWYEICELDVDSICESCLGD